MSRNPTVTALTAVGLVALAVWVAAPIYPLSIAGLAVGVLALASAVGTVLLRTSERVSFATAVGTAFLPAVTLLALVSRSPENIFNWFSVAVFVFVFGTALAYPLGVARTTRHRWIVMAALLVLGELFVAAAVFDNNTLLEMEGLATSIAVLLVPVFVLVAVLLYVLGARRRDADGHDHHPQTRPLVAAVAVPWVVGVAALVVPELLESGLAGLQYTALVAARIGGVPAPSPLLLAFLAVGGACVYAVNRVAGPDGSTTAESQSG